MLKIWGRLSSINVQKVIWCAGDLGCPYERAEAGGAFGVVDTPAYGRLNPNRKVPVIEHDGFVLWESSAILRYLCALHPESGLVPESIRGRAECDRWMDWQATELTPVMRDAFMQLVRTPPGQREPAVIQASATQTESMMAILDDALAGKRFVAGEDFTMADIPLACAVHRWRGLPLERISRPNVDKWFERAAKRRGAMTVLSLPLT
jgi:glutathione S-transferase